MDWIADIIQLFNFDNLKTTTDKLTALGVIITFAGIVIPALFFIIKSFFKEKRVPLPAPNIQITNKIENAPAVA